MLLDNDFGAVCSVTELAGKIGLSRARFYQLMEKGVFPKPVYCTRTRRPFYTLDLQQKCIDIRKTGIGYNQQPVVFYSERRGCQVMNLSQCWMHQDTGADAGACARSAGEAVFTFARVGKP